MMQVIKTDIFVSRDMKGFYLELLSDGVNGMVCIEGEPFFLDPEKLNNLEDLAAVFYKVRLDVFGAVIGLLQGAQDPLLLARAIAKEYA